MTDLEKVLQVVNTVIGVFAPEVAGPAQAIGVIVKDALGVERAITAQVREQEAGRSISKAAKLAGMREAIERHVLDYMQTLTSTDECVSAIVKEVARRMP